MKLSLRCEYALLSLIHLARQKDMPLPWVSIRNSPQIPPEMLHEILTVLADAKILRTTKGQFRLARPAGKIAVIDVIRLFDGALAPVEPVSEKGYRPAPMDTEEKLAGLFSDLQQQIIDRLEGTTLADLA